MVFQDWWDPDRNADSDNDRTQPLSGHCAGGGGRRLPRVSGGRFTSTWFSQAVVDQQSVVIEQLKAELSALKNDFFSVNILAFDLVDLNLGGGYDRVTGIFTAPLPGLYQFSLKMAQTPPGFLHVELAKEDTQIAEVEAQGDTTDRSSATVAISLTTGQRVWTRRR
ncbi:complement C1q tumor necrosis factor-related protein 6-like [Babylonia areolata]|uniref:complement C1q tumor necrosis factor-related protein 6-like n=1 Tax=Babylonia areolata TaxID=304850 RepID=UPI003FD2D7A8